MPESLWGVQLTTMRVECEKAAESAGGDALWELLGDRALATLHLVRAYRERSLHAAYSGLLPPQPHHSSGEPLATHPAARSQLAAAVPDTLMRLLYPVWLLNFLQSVSLALLQLGS